MPGVDATREPGTWPSTVRRLVLFVLLMLVADRLFGVMVGALARRDVGAGRIGAENAVLATDPEILILGSSHARHHYSDSLLSAQTGCRVRNAGQDGTGTLYARGILSLLPRTGHLRLVVLEASWFEDERLRLHMLDPHFGRSARLDSMLTAGDWRATVKLWSRLYRYNGLAGPLARSVVRNDTLRWGFDPLEGRLGSIPSAPEVEDDAPVSPWLDEAITGLIGDVRGIGAELVVTHSPSLAPAMPRSIRAEFVRVATRARVPSWTPPPGEAEFFDGPAVFRDPTHLNRAGAMHLSSLLAQHLIDELGIRCTSALR